ncbi:MAG: heterodisulfide reductase-related iron-sulfur binding cluster [Acidiferrobacteraceae bacterium]
MSSPRDPGGTPGEGSGAREGSVDAPTRHPIAWKDPSFYDENALFVELERVFDICHGCRRCFRLCQSFPTLFDLIDESSSMDLAGVAKKDFWRVVDQCYLCDMCYMTKCPYVPPHPWNVDFPHLMLRAKAVRHRSSGAALRDRVITSTDATGRFATLPVIVNFANAATRSPAVRAGMDRVFGIDRRARLPAYHADTFRRTWPGNETGAGVAAGKTRGRVVLFATCFGNYNEPAILDDLVAVYRHNGIVLRIPDHERCCGMPKLELGDFASVSRCKDENIAELVRLVDGDWDIVAPVPSCVLMFRQELPLMFPGDDAVRRVRERIFDPFEYLALRAKEGAMRTDFTRSLGRISYHVACHQRVQNIGPRTREVLAMVPGTEIEMIERCSGHNGTYAVKREFYDDAMRIGKPVVDQVRAQAPDYYTSDCPLAGHQISHGLADGSEVHHPMRLLRQAYGI